MKGSVPSVLVQRSNAAFLHRKADPGEVAFWNGQLTNGTMNLPQVALDCLSSPEVLSDAARSALPQAHEILPKPGTSIAAMRSGLWTS